MKTNSSAQEGREVASDSRSVGTEQVRSPFFDGEDWNPDSEARIFPVLLEQLLALSGKPRTSLVLDLGCGHGMSTIAFAKRFEKVYAVDNDDHAIEKCKAAVEEEGLTNVHFFNSRAETLSLGKQVDIITCVGFLSHVEGPRLVLQGLFNQLKSDGQLLVADYLIPRSAQETWNELLAPVYDSRSCVTLTNSRSYYRPVRPLDYSQVIDAIVKSGFRVSRFYPLRWTRRLGRDLAVKLPKNYKDYPNLTLADRYVYLHGLEPEIKQALHLQQRDGYWYCEVDCFALAAVKFEGAPAKES